MPLGNKIKDMLEDKTYILDILNDGAEKARGDAEKNLKEIKEIIGFI